MIELRTSRGLPVHVPESPEEDPSPKFHARDPQGITEYYRANGYVVVRSLFNSNDCDYIRNLWDIEIKPSRDFIYRQATSRAEKHTVNAGNWIMNPISNLQSIDPVRYPHFR